MRTLMAVVMLVTAVSVYAALPAAADENTNLKVAAGLTERFQDLALTDEQESRIEAIRKEYRPKVQAAGKDLAGMIKEEVEKVRAVLTPEQRTKLQEAREERRERRAECLAQRIACLQEVELTDGEVARIAEIRKEYRPQIEKALEQCRGLLSDEQRKAREEALKAGKPRREVVQAINLTAEQKEKVLAAGNEVARLVREEMEKIRDVLSDEQRQKLEDLKAERRERVRDRMAHRIATLEGLDLTDQQKTQIASIRNEYRPKIHEAGNKLRATVREEVEALVNVMKG